MNVLIGNGLVGTSLQEQMKFDLVFDTKNSLDFIKSVPEMSNLYLACLPAAKWKVNQNVAADFDNMMNILDLIAMKHYNKVVLFSTIDVYCHSPLYQTESSIPVVANLCYGTNRYLFEQLVQTKLWYKSLKIFRLPALFNKHIKKNVLFDLINNNNVDQININSEYQWYNLDGLVRDMNYLTTNFPNKDLFNVFTAPIDTKDIVALFPQYSIDTMKRDVRITYDHRSEYFGNSSGGYIHDRITVMDYIKRFVNDSMRK
jgi:nucleoside-diphosphate-sugar epimerase